MKIESTKSFHVGDREIEVVASPRLNCGHKPDVGGLIGSKKSQVIVSLYDIENPTSGEPDIFAASIVAAAHQSLDKTLTVEQRERFTSEVHEWLRDRRAAPMSRFAPKRR